MLSKSIADDAELLQMCLKVRSGQLAPNLLFGAVNYLLLKSKESPLSSIYAKVSKGGSLSGSEFETFKYFCIENKRDIQIIVEKRTVQTNDVQRCGIFVPAILSISDKYELKEIEFIDVGASIGLHLWWDMYSYHYPELIISGDKKEASLIIKPKYFGKWPGNLSAHIPRVLHRQGIELDLLDINNPDDELWLEALIWPEHPNRLERFKKALEYAKKNRPPVEQGNAKEILPNTLCERNSPVLLLWSFSANQIFEDGLQGVYSILRSFAGKRLIFTMCLGYIESKTHPSFIVSHVTSTGEEIIYRAKTDLYGDHVEYE